MAKGRNIIKIKREVWLYAPPQPSFTAIISAVEEDLFWINLPRESGQVLMLQENQKIKIRISLVDGFYSAETKVDAIGNDNEKFYGLSTLEEFSRTDRRFVRARYAATVSFADSGLTAQTSLVNFSAGGIRGYLVPELEKMLKSIKRLTAYLEIDKVPFQFPVRLAWRKDLNNIPFAGFEFLEVSPGIQDTLARLAIKYSKNT